MSASVPTQRTAVQPAEVALTPSAAAIADISSAPAAAGARFFHASAASTPDETALASWWCRFCDPLLDRLIEATLVQGYEVCAAALRLQSRCARAPGSGSGSGSGQDDAARAVAGHAFAEAADEAVLYDYYSVRLRQIAITARHYFLALSLQERIACTDAAIAAEAATMRRTHPHHDANAATTHHGDTRPAMLADLHAHRIRLRAQWDAAVIALSHQTAEPLPKLVALMRDQRLPGACAESPALGGPERVRLRRPDVLAQAERAAAAGEDRYAARLAALGCEQREDQALKEVELALATLAAAQAELLPVRASAASAEAQCQRVRRSADPRARFERLRALHAFRDREIETRGRTYLALVDVFHAAGCGWPGLADLTLSGQAPSDHLPPDQGIPA
jgi:outer membrane protein TolC